jgi:alanyl-tRNA synthetase
MGPKEPAMKITGDELRARFLSYFERQSHRRVASAPLLPQGDPTLLFVNAGMVQFKDVFTGREKRDYSRATSSQKCVRAGGKHNDLENVGRTARHHTFFEMLGNFSFGDYFKEEACKMAWEFLTEDLGMDKSRLTVTVFGGEGDLPADEDAERIWRDVVGVPADRISRHGAKDNFWAMGETGPCGPCTEIHYDRGQVEGTFGGDDPEGDQVLEVWNLVFMQFDRQPDGTLNPLPAPSVDTGMGLERLAMVMNGLASNYDTDLLFPFVKYTADKAGKTYTSSDGEDDVSLRVVADHCRTTAFLIADGVLPGNDGRGYVLRRIMRRAIRHGARLGFDQPFFDRCCLKVVDHFSASYPELEKARSLIEKVVRQEEETFRRTLDRGLALFAEATADLNKGDALDGGVVHKLHETYGFPTDLTEVLAGERELQIDWPAYEKAKKEHEEASSQGGLGLAGVDDLFKEIRNKLGATRFVGDAESTHSGKVISLLKGKDPVAVDALGEGDVGIAILDVTPFYGESGGQVGDTGMFTAGGNVVRVKDTGKAAELHLHQVEVEKGQLKVGDSVEARIDEDRRTAIRRNHSATHLVHAALRQILGDHVVQKGSLVDGDRLRFDFSHFEAITEAEMARIEDRVNQWVVANDANQTEEMGFDEAQEKGAMALFGEKYGDSVRVVQLGADSVELCGGTHVGRTGDIGAFKIISEGPLAAGIRRMEALTGPEAMMWVRHEVSALQSAARELSVGDLEVPERIARLKQELKAAEKEVQRLQQKAASAQAGESAASAREVDGIKVIAEELTPGTPAKAMRDYADKLRDQLGSGLVVLASATAEKKCALLVAMTPDLTKRLHAGKMVVELAAIVGGRGGGRPDLAQAGGSEPEKIHEVLAAVDGMIQARS